MKAFFRWLRRSLTLLLVVGVIAAIGYFIFYTGNGILEEIDFRREQARRDDQRQLTATALAPTLEAESQDLSGEMPVNAGLPNVTVTPTPQASLAEGQPASYRAADTSYYAVMSYQGSVWQMPPAQGGGSPTPVPTQIAQDPIPTAFPTNTPPPTAFPTNTPYPSDTPTPTATSTPSSTPTATATFTPSNTPPPTLVIEGTYATPVTTPIIEIIPSAPLVEDSDDIVNFLLMGTDTTGSSLGRTDVMIIVSVNKRAETVAMWHIPRDLLVYIPGYTIDRINRAFPVGAQNGWPGGGPGLMKETILFNFGIKIDYYARVDFGDFQEIIDELGGLTISVDCQITDWRLIDPTTPLDVAQGDDWEQYWEQYTMTVGVHTLDPYMALWYARSRVTTNDFDRGRRQIDILRAMWQQARANGLFSQVTNLWPRAIEIIDTDMGLEDVLSFVPLAIALEPSDIERYNLKLGVHVQNWETPDDGRSVLLPDWQKIRELAQQFVTPPTELRLKRSAKTIEIFDGTQYGIGWAQVAADRLAWEGFAPTIQESRDVARHDITLIYDYTGDTKGSELKRLQDILRVGNNAVQIEPNPDREFDYRVVIGRSYNSCIYGSSAEDLPDVPPDVVSAAG